jgi:hypothetical protein
MPAYYDFARDLTSNGTTGTLSTHFRFLSVANQAVGRLVLLCGGCRFATAGGGILRVVTAGAAGTGGTAQTLQPKRPTFPAAATTLFNDASAITPGTGPILRIVIGLAQTGGMGGYTPAEPDDAVQLMPNGGANGNMEIGSMFNGTAVTFSISGDFSE